MAQFYEDFENSPIGSGLPSILSADRSHGSTGIEAAAWASNGKILRYKGLSGRVFTWFNEFPNDVLDYDIIMSYRQTSSTTSSTQDARIMGRHINQEDAIVCGRNNNGDLGIQTIVGGSFDSLSTKTAQIVPQGTTIFVRCQVSENTARVKEWTDNVQDQPAEWDLEFSGLPISSPGDIGWFSFGANVEWLLDWYSLGTDGDPAPTGPISTPGNISLSSTSESESTSTGNLSVDVDQGTQFFRSFRNESTGSFSDPSFTNVTGSASIVDNGYNHGNALLCSGSTWSSVALTGFPHTETVEVSGVVAITDDESQQQRAINLYTSDGTGYLTGNGDAYSVRLFDTAMIIFKVSEGSETSHGLGGPSEVKDGDVLTLRAEPEGSSLKLTALFNGVVEVEWTDDDPLPLPPGGGIAALVNRGGQSNSAWYSVGVGIDNDPAPVESLPESSQFFWTAEDYDVGQDLSPEFDVYGAAEIDIKDSGGKYLEFSGANANDGYFVYNPIPSSKNSEMYCRWQREGGFDASVMVRIQGTSTSTVTGTRGDVIAWSGEAIRITSYLNGNYSQESRLDMSVGDPSDIMNMRYRVNGDNHFLRFWLNDDPEPSDWTLEFTSDRVPDAGLFGFNRYRGVARIYEVGYGTHGAPAPKQPLATPDDIFLVSTSESTTDATSVLTQDLNGASTSLSESISAGDLEVLTPFTPIPTNLAISLITENSARATWERGINE